jgi:hypothetical protein
MMRGPTFVLALMLFALGSQVAVASARPVDEPKAQEQGPSAQTAALRPMIVLQGNRLSVRVQNVSWETVAKELERQTGILIRMDGHLAGTLTQDFQGLPLEQGLRRLFRQANLLFFYAAAHGASEARLTRLWLFPKEGGPGEAKQIRASSTGAAIAVGKREEVESMGETAEATSHEEGEPVAEEDNQEERLTRLQTFAQQGDVAALQQAVFDPDQTIQMAALEVLAEQDQQDAIALLLSATKSDQPERRFQALNLLYQTGQADERTILSALSEALADADTNVKGYAIQALAERGGPDALEPLRQVLHDPDPAIRMRVIEHVMPEEQGLALLQEALSDEDETLRSAAASKLEQPVSENQEDQSAPR